jgi:hypothetical protein
LNAGAAGKTSASSIDSAAIYAARRADVTKAGRSLAPRSDGLVPWSEIADKLNRDAGLDTEAIYARRREAVRG